MGLCGGGWAGTDLVWVMDMGWASPNLATLAVKKTFGLPATVGFGVTEVSIRLLQACSRPFLSLVGGNRNLS